VAPKEEGEDLATVLYGRKALKNSQKERMNEYFEESLNSH